MRKNWMMGTALAVAVALGACGGDRDTDTAVADSLDRDLQLAPVDTTATLGEPTTDEAPATTGQAPQQQAPRQQTQAPAPAPRQETQQPAPSRPASTALSLASGTEFTAVTASQISSATNKQGETVTARIGTAVRDSRGRVVIPAGAELQMRIAAIRESENKSDQTGTLTLEPTAVVIDGQSYPLTATISALETKLVDRGTNVGDVAKVGGGAAAGAVVGRVLGGSTKGAVIGGIIGGAVGAQRAVETQDRDVVVPEGTTMTLTLTAPFSRG